MTARVARAAFPKGCLCLRMRDELGPVFTDEQFVDLFGRRGKPGLSPARLAWVLVLQFLEGLTDRQAADAVRSRIDWKYLLGLELDDSGFDFSVLSEFRDRLVAGQAQRQLLDVLLESLRDKGLLKRGGKARTDATHVLAAVRVLNRVENVFITVRAALEAVAEVDGAWLASWMPVDWPDRYGQALRMPKTEKARGELGDVVGRDGWRLWAAVTGPDAPAGLAGLGAVEVLRRVWVQQYVCDEAGRVRWRGDDDGQPPAGVRIDSPFDVDARRAVKRGMGWTGYKAHFTETCDPDTPHVIVRAEATAATVHDSAQTGRVHADLAARDLLPGEHFLDNGYIDAGEVVVAWRAYGVELVGPLRQDSSWQARAGAGFDLAGFVLDFDQERAVCPEGQASSAWRERARAGGSSRVHVEFSPRQCRPCRSRAACVRGKATHRNLTLRTRVEHEVLMANRAAQATREWKDRYKTRAGVEGTVSQAVNGFGMRTARYVGLAKVGLQATVTAVAINLARVDAWLAGTPHARTRVSRLATLGQVMAA